jgi:protein-disulfide isomerase
LAANEQGKFIEMYTALLGSNERLDEAKINAIAEKLGLDMAKFNADVAAQKTQDAINNVAQLGNKLQIHGVPSLVLNGSPLQTISVEGIQAEINNLK